MRLLQLCTPGHTGDGRPVPPPLASQDFCGCVLTDGKTQPWEMEPAPFYLAVHLAQPVARPEGPADKALAKELAPRRRAHSGGTSSQLGTGSKGCVQTLSSC